MRWPCVTPELELLGWLESLVQPYPVGRITHDGGGVTHDGGVEVTKGRKHGFSFHDLDDLSADEKVSHLCAVRLTDSLAACGPESSRGNGLCESLFR